MSGLKRVNHKPLHEAADVDDVLDVWSWPSRAGGISPRPVTREDVDEIEHRAKK
jgi:hypothetical protein